MRFRACHCTPARALSTSCLRPNPGYNPGYKLKPILTNDWEKGRRIPLVKPDKPISLLKVHEVALSKVDGPLTRMGGYVAQKA